jgi:hypothetical protein
VQVACTYTNLAITPVACVTVCNNDL